VTQTNSQDMNTRLTLTQSDDTRISNICTQDTTIQRIVAYIEH